MHPITGPCLQATWEMEQRRRWLLPSLRSGKTAHVWQSIRHLLLVSRCSPTTVWVQGGWQELVTQRRSLNLSNEVAPNARDGSQHGPARGVTAALSGGGPVAEHASPLTAR